MKFTAASGLSPAKRFKGIRKAEKKKYTAEERRERNLQEIFYFYARQHIQSNMEFQEFQDELKKIDLGEFSCIIRDFQIALPKTKIADLFKKASVNGGSLEVPEFKEALRVLGKEYSKAKLRENKERGRLLRKVIEDLAIPKEYRNKQHRQAFHDKITAIL